MNDSLLQSIDALIKTSKSTGILMEIKKVDPLMLSQIEKQFDLPSDLSLFYSIIDPVDIKIPRPPEDIYLLSPSHLEKSLHGYAYSYVKTENEVKLSGVWEHSWDRQWLVIGGEGEFPIIMMRNKSNDNAVYYGKSNGTGWILSVLSYNFGGFLNGLKEYLDLYFNKYNEEIYIGKLSDSNYALNPDFITDFSNLLNKNESTKNLGPVWLNEWLGL